MAAKMTTTVALIYKTTCLAVMLLPVSVDAHARLFNPPSRVSMFRFGFDNPSSFNDMGYNCAGARVSDFQNFEIASGSSI